MTSILPWRHEPSSGKLVQMVVIEHGLKSFVDTLDVGFMMYVPPASHWVELRGQQIQLLPEHGQVLDVQS